jgi:hypothetical protein
MLSKIIYSKEDQGYIDSEFSGMEKQTVEVKTSESTLSGARADFDAMMQSNSKIALAFERAKQLNGAIKMGEHKPDVMKFAMKEMIHTWSHDNSSGMDSFLLEKLTRKFADPNTLYANQLLGNYTLEQINVLISDIGTSIEKENALTQFCPNVNRTSFNAISTIWDRPAGIAPEMGVDSAPIPSVNMLGNRQQNYVYGQWGFKISINAQNIFYARKMGGTSSFGDDGLPQLISLHTIFGQILLNTRKKQVIANAILNNAFTYNGRTVNMGIPADNILHMNPIGTLNADGTFNQSSYSTSSNPMVDLNNMLSQRRLATQLVQYADLLLFHDYDLTNIMNNPLVKASQNYMMMGKGRVPDDNQIKNSSKYFNKYWQAPSLDIPCGSMMDSWIESNAYGQSTPSTVTNDNTKYFLPQGRFVVLTNFANSANNSTGHSMQWANTPNQLDPMQEAIGEFTAVVPRNIQNSETTTNRLDLFFGLSGGPEPIRPSGIWTGDSIYSNI